MCVNKCHLDRAWWEEEEDKGRILDEQKTQVPLDGFVCSQTRLTSGERRNTSDNDVLP